MQTDDSSTRKRYNSTNQWYNRKKHKKFVLEPGMTGFLCTCNFQEKGCVTDAYKLFNLFANDEESTASEINEEPEVSTSDEKGTEEDVENTEEQEEEDISTSLEKEVKELRTLHEAPVSFRKFQVADTGVKNLVFIKSTLPNPLELVTKIVTKLDATKEQCTRYLLRLLPIELVCKANLDNIRTKASSVFEKYFAQEPKTFSIIVNRHSNNSIKRSEVIEDLAEIILQMNPGNKADLKNPEIAVVVEVIRGVCLISIAPHYYKFKKYNLLEICDGTKTKDTRISSSDKTASPEHEENDAKGSDVPAASAEKEEDSSALEADENQVSSMPSDEQAMQA